MQNNDLISREAAKKIVSLMVCAPTIKIVAEHKIDEIPSVDAVPEVHAYWWYEDLDGLWCCSHCNGGELVNQRKYCPDCGALMDGGNN